MSETQDTHAAEEWRAVVGYEGLYEVSDLGRVRSVTAMVGGVFGRTQIRRGRILRRQTGAYPAVVLSRSGKVKTLRVHKLVLDAFVGPRPEGMEARHFPDRDAQNCQLKNLAWGTAKENSNDKQIHGSILRGEQVVTAKLTVADVVKIRALCKSRALTQERIGMMFGIHHNSVGRIFRGERWGHLKDAS